MTVETTAVSKTYKPGAAMAPEPIPFAFLDATDIVVTHIAAATGMRTPLTYGQDYIVTGDGSLVQGSLSPLAAWPGDDEFLVQRVTQAVQVARIVPHEPLPAVEAERQLDRMAMHGQEQAEQVRDTQSRALMVPAGKTIGDLIVAPNTALTFDASGNPVTKPIGSFPAGPTGTSDNTYHSYAKLQASDPTRAVARLVGDTDVPPHPDGNYNNPTQTVGGWVPQQAAGVSYGKSVNIALPLDKSLPRTAGYFGVDPFTTASQHSKLESMFTAASDDGLFLNLHPDAKYRKDGPLRLAGNARLDGQGATLMPLSDGPQALVAGVGLPLAPGFTLMNLRLLGASTNRTSNPGDNGIFLGDVGQPIVKDFLLFNIEIGSVDDPTSSTARGVGAAAFYFGNAQRGRIAQCRAIRSKADAFHVIHGSKDLQFDQPFAYAAGDDSFAVVSYVTGGALCERILWNQPVSINGGARVCSVVGGRDVVFEAPIGLNSAAAGVYFASEDSFNTLGVDNCHVKRGTFIGACQGSAATGPNFRQAGTLLLGRAGSDTISGEVISRSVQRCSIEATIRGDGPSMTVIHDCQSLYNSKNKIDLQAYNTTAAGALAIGGQDTEIRFRGGNIGGLLGFIGQNTRGVLKLDVDCDGSRIAGTSPQNVNIFVQGNGPTEVRLTGDIRGGPAQFFGGDGFDFSKLYWRDVLFNGGRQLDRNIQVGVISYATGWSSSSNHPVRIERDPAGTAILSGEFTGGTTSAGTLVATLPGGYAPTEPTRQPVANADGTVGAVSVATNGAITILAGVTGAFQINLPIRTGRA